MTSQVSLVIPQHLYAGITDHLFPGDHDEHGLIIAAGVHNHDGHLRLLVREVFFAVDGKDYVKGQRGYRMLKAEFIHSKIRYCREKKLAYLAVHNHGGRDSVAFSADDIASHERGYPALLDLGDGIPVGALVFARWAIAGDIWLPTGQRLPLSETRVIGPNVSRHYEAKRNTSKGSIEALYDRQALMFGEHGQKLLRDAKVGVIGAGGAGSLLIEYLARLGVGHVVVTDPDKIEPSNLSRVVGATYWDARLPFSSSSLPWLRHWALKLASLKVAIARRVAKKANPSVRIEVMTEDFSRMHCALKFADCDFLFLAADSMSARLVFNAIVHQYFVPGIQVGAKVVVNEDSDRLADSFSVVRWLSPSTNCLWCSGMISPNQLAIEAKSEKERKEQAYGTAQKNPSVITMNALAAAQAANDFLFSYLGLHDPSVTVTPRRFRHLSRSVIDETYPASAECPECSQARHSRFGMGDAARLPVSGP